MKRKFKLFATIASLCLSVALMAFGVYAAVSTTYTVTSTVTFTSQVHVKWTGAVAGGKDAATTDTQNLETNPASTDAQDFTWNITEPLQFGVADDAQKTITYTFTCKNLGKDTIYVDATASKLFGDANLTVNVKAGKGEPAALTGEGTATIPTDAVALAESEVYSLVIKVVLVDTTQSIGENNALNLVLTADKEA